MATRSPFDTVIALSVVGTGSHSSELSCEYSYVLLLDREQKAYCCLLCIFIDRMPSQPLLSDLPCEQVGGREVGSQIDQKLDQQHDATVIPSEDALSGGPISEYLYHPRQSG